MEADSPTEVLKNEKVIQVNAAKEDRTDTASRRSIVEKKSLWESSESDQNTPDPALLPLSQRMAKFEKLGSVPKPIARFGEPITPAMLAKASAGNRSNFVPASEPAWKRQKRDRSPNKQPFLTPGNDVLERKVSFEDSSSGTPALKRGNIDTKKNLFENNWKHNDIARGQEENKRKELEICMNRFKKPNQDHERERSRSPQRRSVSPTPQRAKSPSPVKISPGRKTNSPKKSPAKSPEEKYYPGVNSLKRIKVSPPRAGQLYPDLTEIHDERPETSMSGESSAPSEAPSLGTAIKRAASANRFVQTIIL